MINNMRKQIEHYLRPLRNLDDSGINLLANQRDLEDGDRPPSSSHLVYSSTQTPYSLNLPSSINDTRRLVIPENRFHNSTQIHRRAKSASFTRSLFSESDHLTKDLIICFRLLRICDHLNECSYETFLKLVNSRYLAFRIQRSNFNPIIQIPPTIKLLQNLQTLVVSSYKIAEPVSLPFGIWFMPHLRHIEIEEEAILPDPQVPCSQNVLRRSTDYLNNLQTLSTIRNFRCDNENLLAILRNLKKLKITVPRYGDYHLNNLVHLQKLQSLSCRGFGKILLGDQAFPDSIKKLTLNWLKLPWKNMSIIGCLPNLEVLKLRGAAYGEGWNTEEGGFLKLKLLLLESLDLCHWEAESSHFPRLESLIIRYCKELEEIPFGIGEIPTLKLIELYHCGEDANSSAEQIQEEQRSLGNEDLQVRVKVWTAFIDED
ncbi:putative late blight resistance protein homolog R1B-16 [Primulina tabacum]|uniref:putative late blight resistance protein homolog R1B-16 n=1 Tax=Primulina tabacum TaxID=48773 RepID=UPI003F595279